MNKTEFATKCTKAIGGFPTVSEIKVYGQDILRSRSRSRSRSRLSSIMNEYVYGEQQPIRIKFLTLLCIQPQQENITNKIQDVQSINTNFCQYVPVAMNVIRKGRSDQ